MLKKLLIGITASIITTASTQAETFSPLPKILDCTMTVFGTFDVTDQSGASVRDTQDGDAFVTKVGSGSYLTILREDGTMTYLGNIDGGEEIAFGRERVTFHRDSQNLFWFFESVPEYESGDTPTVTTGRIICQE